MKSYTVKNLRSINHSIVLKNNEYLTFLGYLSDPIIEYVMVRIQLNYHFVTTGQFPADL